MIFLTVWKSQKVMERKEDAIQVLNDLLKINNDRIREYRKAAKQIIDFDWRTLFLSMIDESKKFATELVLAILQKGGVPHSATTSGKIYRFWVEMKDTFTGMDRESILNECEFVEDAALKAYNRALENEDLTAELALLISKQLESLHSSKLTLNRYRDMSLFDLYKVGIIK